MSYLDTYRNRVNIKGSTEKERILNIMKSDFDKYKKNAPNSYDVVIKRTGELYNVVIQDHSYIELDLEDEKYILFDLEADVMCGDSYAWDDISWLIIKKANRTIKSHQSFISKKCNYILNFINKYGNVVSYPCITSPFTLYSDGASDGTKIPIQEKKKEIIIQTNDDTLILDTNYRIIIDRNVYFITSVKDKVNEGLLKIVAVETENTEKDDFVNGIAHNDIQIVEDKINALIISGEEGVTDTIWFSEYWYSFTAKLYDENGDLVEPQPSIIYSVDDETIINIITEDGKFKVQTIIPENKVPKTFTITANDGTNEASKNIRIE